MKVLILAGGYGRRLFPLTEFRAKPLLPVCGKPMLDYIWEKLPPLPLIISTNQKYAKDFEKWRKERKIEGKILVEESREEKDKLGSVGGLLFAIEKEKIKEPLLVVAGDNLFDFSLGDLVENLKEEIRVALYDIKDKEKIRGKLGNVEVNKEGIIINFIEKPSHPVSTLVSTGCYLFPPSSFPLLKEFYRKADKEKRDKMGYLIQWFMEEGKIPVKGITYQGLWIDIGGRTSYLEANLKLSGKEFYCDENTQVINSSLYRSVILKGSRIIDSTLEGCIVDEDCWIEGVKLKDTIVGKGSIIKKST